MVVGTISHKQAPVLVKVYNQMTEPKWVVAYVHWGANYEGLKGHQKRFASEFAKSGYDLVVGHGSHTPQLVGKVGDTPILYSLGNFTFTSALYAQVDALVATEGNATLTVQVAGMPTFLKAAQDGVKASIDRMDTISLPLALLVFILMLRSARLLLLPILNIAVVVSTAFAIMYPVSRHLAVASTVPSLMLSVSIATSVDYVSRRRAPALD